MRLHRALPTQAPPESEMASAIPSSRPKHYGLFLSFGPSPLPRLLRPLLTSAVRSEHLTMSSVTESVTHSRSPAISSTAFHAPPPDLPPVSLMDMGFAISCLLARHRRPHHPVLVHRHACLLHASFRPHLAVTPLRFATLHLHQVGRGLSPPSCRTCTAYNKKPRRKGEAQFLFETVLHVER